METKLTYGGEIINFPIEVVNKMLERQFEQIGKKDVSVFEKYRGAGSDECGFYWGETIEGLSFWENVIDKQNFDLFFKKYPKENKLQIEVIDTATEQLKELSEKALALRLEQEAINFEVWVSGYENHNQAMKHFEVETMSELYAKFKQMTNGN